MKWKSGHFSWKNENCFIIIATTTWIVAALATTVAHALFPI